jgi:hypothetical protein
MASNGDVITVVDHHAPNQCAAAKLLHKRARMWLAPSCPPCCSSAGAPHPQDASSPAYPPLSYSTVGVPARRLLLPVPVMLLRWRAPTPELLLRRRALLLGSSTAASGWGGGVAVEARIRGSRSRCGAPLMAHGGEAARGRRVRLRLQRVWPELR